MSPVPFPLFRHPNGVWTYEQVREWILNNLEITITQNGYDLCVEFTPFPQQVLTYIQNHCNKRGLWDQIIIFPCTTRTRRARMSKYTEGSVNKITPSKSDFIGRRGYTIPLRQPMHSSRSRHWRFMRKTWRILPLKSAALGRYIYFNFFKTDEEFQEDYANFGFLTKRAITAEYLSGIGSSNSYMIAISIVKPTLNGYSITENAILSNNTLSMRYVNKLLDRETTITTDIANQK